MSEANATPPIVLHAAPFQRLLVGYVQHRNACRHGGRRLFHASPGAVAIGSERAMESDCTGYDPTVHDKGLDH